MATYTDTPAARSEIRWAIYPIFLQFPVVCFTLTLLTDIAYWATENLMWQNFSSWLLLAGNVLAVVAAVVAVLEFALGSPEARLGWVLAVGSVVAFVLSVLNSFVHAGDGWTAVVPWGLTLSAATVIVMLITVIAHRRVVFSGYSGVRRHG